MIKVLTDQPASDSEPAIILTESNEHSKPCSAPNMKGDVICWQLASRRGSRREGKNGRRGEDRARERKKSVTRREKGDGEQEGRERLSSAWFCCPTSWFPVKGTAMSMSESTGVMNGAPPLLRNLQCPPLPGG